MAKATASKRLEEYRRKRDFGKTPEPSGRVSAGREKDLRFVIQKHDASQLHYDLRLEMEGVMRSWAVPKGPSLDPKVRRLAMEVEDHPMEYNDFEGTIPEGEYGGGTVMLWDRGTYVPDEIGPGEKPADAALRGYREGKLSFTLRGERLRGSFALVRTDAVEGGVRSKWLLLKHRDDEASPGSSITDEVTTSIASDRTMEEIADGKGDARVWHSDRPSRKGAKSRPAGKAPDLSAFSPMLATSVPEPPEGPDWVYELKYDGIRVLAFVTPDVVALVTRNGRDKARQFPEIVDALKQLSADVGRDFVLDGEIVALQDDRIGRFEGLQGRMHLTDGSRIERLARDTPAAFVAFDILLDGEDGYVQEPLSNRRKALEQLLEGRTSSTIQLSVVSTDRAELVRRSRREGWEGIIAKRKDARYQPGRRTTDWLKIKLENRQELVVGGWTEPRGSRAFLGAILLGYYDDGEFVYAGHTGTGFDRASLEEMHRRLQPLERKTPPFSTQPRTNQPAHWTTPKVVVEVRFNEWTRDGKLRQPVFVGIRDDKDPKEVVREPIAAVDGASSERSSKPPSTGKRADRQARKDGDGGARKARASQTKSGGARKADASQKKNGGSQKARNSQDKAGSRKQNPGARTSSRREPAEVARIREIAESGRDGRLELDGGSLSLTNLGKVFYPKTGHTKGDLLIYYARMSPYILPWMEDRPLVLKRFPNGVDEESFYQQAAPDSVPEGVRVETLRIEGKRQRRLVGGNLATLLYTIQLGAISYDPWHSRTGHLREPDYTILDLDPSPGADLKVVVEVAKRLRSEMEELGLHGAVKSSGSRGLHIYLPLPPGTPLDAATLVAQIVATRVAEKYPDIATVERMTRKRPRGTVYVDYLQNILGKTVAGVYAARARETPTVSAPLEWDEVDDSLDLAEFTIDTVPERVERLGDLWAPAMAKPNSLEQLLETVQA